MCKKVDGHPNTAHDILPRQIRGMKKRINRHYRHGIGNMTESIYVFCADLFRERLRKRLRAHARCADRVKRDLAYTIGDTVVRAKCSQSTTEAVAHAVDVRWIFAANIRANIFRKGFPRFLKPNMHRMAAITPAISCTKIRHPIAPTKRTGPSYRHENLAPSAPFAISDIAKATESWMAMSSCASGKTGVVGNVK